MGVLNNYFQLLLITFQIIYELQLPKIIIIDASNKIQVLNR